MKRFLLTPVCLLLAAPLLAATTATTTTATTPATTSTTSSSTTSSGDSLHFSTAPGAAYAWELTRSGSQWTLSFAPNAVIVDNSTPTDAKLQGDYVQLPTMTITGITDRGNFLTATLSPSQSLTVNSHTGNTAVMTASMQSGGMLAIGTNMVAYSQQSNDLSIKSYDKSYGVVIPTLAGDSGKGLLLDLSFSGDAIRGGNLYNVLRSNSGTVRGTLSGQISGISAIPEPATVLLLGLGAVLASRCRSRRRG
jgi:hypothetical protein